MNNFCKKIKKDRGNWIKNFNNIVKEFYRRSFMNEVDKDKVIETNKYLIDKLVQEGLKIISDNYKVKEETVGEYSRLNIQGRECCIKQYEIEKFGNLFIMECKDSNNIQLFTFVITPYYKEIPLFSADYLFIQQIRNSIIEYYDLVKHKNEEYLQYVNKFQSIKDKYGMLKDMDLKESWDEKLKTIYIAKSSDVSMDNKIINMFSENLKMYVEMEKFTDFLREWKCEIQYQIIEKYINELIKKGGVSTDIFKLSLGEEKTREFFNKVLFSTERYNKWS